MKYNRKRTWIQILPNILFVGIIMLVLVAGFIRTVFLPKDINYYENRYSNKVIVPTVNSLFNNSFQDSVENALADQVPGAQRLKQLYNDTTSGFANFWVRPILERNDTTYIYYHGMLIFGGYYVFASRDMDTTKPLLNAKAENYNALMEKYPGVDFYAYYIEKDTDINFENGNKLNADDYLFSLLHLDDSRMRSFEIEDFQAFTKLFYKTDHHWKHTGSYAAYTDIVDFLECSGEPLKHGKEVLVSGEFTGSKASLAGSNIITEPFLAYEFDLPELKITINGSPAEDYGAQRAFLSGSTDATITYGNFYGGDDGEIIFDTGATDLDNILIIGESYDNAILKLLATHFHKTYSIDLRNYQHYSGKKFDFGKYVAENEIDKVLFIGNVDFYIGNIFELENE